MTSRFERLLTHLDGGTRIGRAFAEALRDHAHEWADARTASDRLVVSAHTASAFARVAGLVAVAEAARMPLLGALAFVLPPSIALAVLGWGHHARVSDVAWDGRFFLAVCAFPQALLVVLPVATFAYVVAGQSRHGQKPIAGVAAVAFCVTVALGFAVVPLGNREFHAVTYQAGGGLFAMPAGPSELGPTELVRRALVSPFGPAAGVVAFRLGLAALAVMLTIVGSWVATLPMITAKRYGISTLAVYGIAIMVLPSSWELGGHASAAVGLLPWLALGAVALVLRSLRSVHRMAAASVLVSLFFGASVGLQAQVRPDLSGRWRLEGAPADNAVLMLIKQTPGDITVMDSDARTGPLHHVRFVFGQLTPQESDVANINVASVASWSADVLVVKTTLSSGTPAGVLSEKEARWSLDAEGRIVVVEVSRRSGRPDVLQRVVFVRQ